MAERTRERLIVGNWKMYKTQAEAEAYLADLIPRVKDAPVGVYLSVPFTLIQPAVEKTQGTNIVIGAQNMNDASEGAFTGEIAGRMLRDVGAQFVIIGHSERRRFFGETDALISRKIKRALDCGLRPLLCVGESLVERSQGKTNDVLQQQLKAGLAGVSAEQASKLIMAYEPVWAIGTGDTATPTQAQEVQQFLRQSLISLWNEPAATQMAILYGGSVHPDNSAALLEQPDIDGLLVGGASLSPELFSQIVHSFHPSPLGNET